MRTIIMLSTLGIVALAPAAARADDASCVNQLIHPPTYDLHAKLRLSGEQSARIEELRRAAREIMAQRNRVAAELEATFRHDAPQQERDRLARRHHRLTRRMESIHEALLDVLTPGQRARCSGEVRRRVAVDHQRSALLLERRPRALRVRQLVPAPRVARWIDHRRVQHTRNPLPHRRRPW